MNGQLWRFLTSFLVFENMTQCIFALILLYNLNMFERQMGSRKFAAFLVLSWLFAALLGLAAGSMANMSGMHLVPSPGPYFLIFAQLAFYHSESASFPSALS